MRRRCFLEVSNEGINVSDSSACDVCFYNKTTGKLLIVKGDDLDTSAYPSSNYTPVGVVVVPGTHDVYGDGSCGVMSLVDMSYSTPNSGTSNREDILFGTSVNTSLTNYTVVCHVGNGTINNTIKGTTTYVLLPTDSYTWFKNNDYGDEYIADFTNNPYDTDTYYYDYGSTNEYYAPSPYKEDGTRNPLYYQTSSPSSTKNALSDFNGLGNTETLTGLATAQSDWKTASTITNSGETGFYPAACCCWRYCPTGTKQGDWYLPALGELGYAFVKITKINETLDFLKRYISNLEPFIQTVDTYYNSSSEYNASNFWQLSVDGIGTSYKNDIENGNFEGSVRAFLRVK